MSSDAVHTVYRLTKRKRAGDLSGEGSRRVGGRYNHVGTPALYTSESVALALLEVLVHVQLVGSYPDDYQVTVLNIRDTKLVKLDLEVAQTANSASHGDSLLHDTEILGFWVPSVIVPTESNLVLNPSCVYFAKSVRVVEIRDLTIDPRLVSG